MTYRFVAAGAPDYGARKGPALAFVVHMTEGSGTEADVDYLAGSPARGVSVHYVILATGEIVQMLPELRASGSLDPTGIRTTDDPPFTDPTGLRVTYGATVRKAVMGAWDRDPNSAVISCEVGGKAANGPNAAQSAALAALVADVRSRYPGIAALGHRDFQDVKPCPGRLVRWGDLGGHGQPEDDMQVKGKGEEWVNAKGRTTPAPIRDAPSRTANAVGGLALGATIGTIAEVTAQDGSLWRLTLLDDGSSGFLLRSDLDPVVPGGDPAVNAELVDFCQRKKAAAAQYPVTGSIVVGGKSVSVTGTVTLP